MSSPNGSFQRQGPNTLHAEVPVLMLNSGDRQLRLLQAADQNLTLQALSLKELPRSIDL